MRNKIKILHILSRMDIGGLENGVVSICNGLDREIFQPSLCCVKGGGAMLQRLSSDTHVEILDCTEGKSPLRLFKVMGFIKRQKPDIVHTHAWGQCSFDGILGGKLARVPIIINGEHGLFFKTFRQKILQRIVGLLCDKILSVSSSLKSEVHEKIGIPLHRITAIYNGVDTEKFNGKYDISKIKNELNKDYNLNIQENTFIISCIGSLKPVKNQKMIIDAMQILANNKDDKNKIRILIIGDGPDRKPLEALSENYNLKGNIAFLGQRGDIPQLLSLIDVLVSTSNSEGLSNVLLESMASGIPVISTDCSGSLEIIKNGFNGLIIHRESPQSLADKIAYLSNNPNTAAIMGINARQYVEKSFSLQQMIRNYEALYKRLFNKHTKL